MKKDSDSVRAASDELSRERVVQPMAEAWSCACRECFGGSYANGGVTQAKRAVCLAAGNREQHVKVQLRLSLGMVSESFETKPIKEEKIIFSVSIVPYQHHPIFCVSNTTSPKHQRPALRMNRGKPWLPRTFSLLTADSPDKRPGPGGAR
jgi:hypothetical protein